MQSLKYKSHTVKNKSENVSEYSHKVFGVVVIVEVVVVVVEVEEEVAVVVVE